GGYIEVAGAALGGIDDDAAAGQANRQVAAGLRGGNAGALAQFDDGAVAQLQHGVGIGGGAQFEIVGQVRASQDRTNPAVGNFVERAIHGLHQGTAGAHTVLIERNPDGETGGGQHDGGGSPADGVAARLHGARR